MKGLKYGWSALAVAALLVGVSSCGGDDSHSGTVPPPVTTTGVVSTGVITGFGSVYVNGVRYDTSGAQVSVNGAAATESDLKVGQYVQVKGHSQGAAHYADVIRYHNVLEGPIATIDTATSSFVAMGQTVLVTADTSWGDDIIPASIEGLAEGDVVEVSGLVVADGAITATRIDIKPDGGPYDVTGYVANLLPDAKRFNISALVVDYSSANMEDFTTGQPSLGDLVLVKGSTFNKDGSFLATRVELRSDDWIKPAAGDEVEVEGAITDFLSPTDFKVAGQPVTTTPTTLYEHGTVDNLANDVMVEVEGTANATGVLVALKVKFKEIASIRIVAPIEELTGGNAMKLLGLTVVTDQATRYDDKSELDLRDLGYSNLAVGNWVDVRGYEEPAGSVTATQVVRIDAADAVRLRGPYLETARPNFHILSVEVLTTDTTRFVLEEGIRLTADEFFTQATGEIVEVWGSWANSTLTAERAEIKVNDD